MSIKITDETINKVINENELVIIDFYADWCMPCKVLGPIIDELAKDNPEVSIGKIDVTENVISSQKYMVSSIPCVIFIKNGDEVARFKGVKSKSVFQDKINEFID